MRTRDMTTGSPVRLILSFALPLFIGNIFQQVYTLVDTMIAGHYLGDNAIAAIGAGGALYGLLINLVWGLNSGFSIIITQCFGARDISRLRKSVAATSILDMTITAALTAVSICFLRPMMHALNTPDGIFEDAYSYMFIICAGMLGTMAYNMFAGIMRAFGNSKTPLYALMFCSVMNVILDIVFIAWLGMGVSGAALATIISQILSGVICGVYVTKNYHEFMPDLMKPEDMPSRQLVREMMMTGGAMSLMYSIVNIGSVIFQGAVNTLGETIISAHTASERIINVLMGPTATIMDASSTFVGQNWGAGRKDRIRYSLRKTMEMEVIWGAAATALVYIADEAIMKLITGTDDPQIIEYGVMNLRTVLPFFPVLGILLVQRTAMQAMGQKTAPIVSSIIEVAMRAFGAWVMVPMMGYTGVCRNTPLTWTVMTVFIMIVYFVSTRKRLEIRRYRNVQQAV